MQPRMTDHYPTLSGQSVPIPDEEDGPPRFFLRRAHWLRNPNHPATAAGGVGPRPPPPSSPAPQPPPPRQDPPPTQDSSGEKYTEHKYELLLAFQVATEAYFATTRQRLFEKLPLGGSVHRPIVLDDDSDEDENVPVQDLARTLQF
jgi:hypothetical protein